MKKMKLSLMTFEEALRHLSEKANAGPVTIRTFLKELSGKGKLLLLIFICLPLAQIPVVALGSGLLMCYLGLRMSFLSQKIFLPSSFLRKKIPAYLLKKSLRRLLRFLKFMKRWTRPRYIWAVDHPLTHKLNGILIAIVGVCLALCPPLPATGYFAFVAIFLMAIGILNHDGIYILLGYASAVLYLAFVIVALKFFSLSKIIDLVNCTFCGLEA